MAALMMRHRYLVPAVAVIAFASACGGETLGLVDGSTDATSDAGADAPFAAADASVVTDGGGGTTDADAEGAGVQCTDGNYFVQVIDDAGTQTLSTGCGDADIPSAFLGGCGDKLMCMYVVACGGGSIQLASIGGWSPGSHTVVASYAVGDASANTYGGTNYGGTITLSDWPDAGGLVAGEYSANSQSAGSISGTFCVVRR